MVGGLHDAEIAAAIRSHHERWDGGGYPDGLQGRTIPLFARIIAVADTFDAITSTRSYRERSTRRRALAVVVEEKGRQLDPEAVDAFVETLPAPIPIAGIAGLIGPQRLIGKAAYWFRR